ncbi:MAG TPA: MFS transporter [Candidatus Acidoferrales bacterium]|nr:MFS transporter [Candidatus Acidoferrales bacterium]
MSPAGKFRAACYTIEGTNSFAVTFYLNYVYFYFHDRFGFNDRQNLELAALIGVVCIFAPLAAGKFANRFGYFLTLKIGFIVMAAGLAIGSQFGSITMSAVAACTVMAGTSCIWPVLETFVSRGANPARSIGIYNLVWAGTNAIAFFIGGTLIEKFGYGSFFYLPLGLMVLQFASIFWLEKIQPKPVAAAAAQDFTPPESHRRTPAQAKTFQRMAWLANPLAYVAVTTLIAVLPGIAHKFELSPMFAGFACSLWCFVRGAAFIVLWRWTGWHYRFRWLITAYLLMVASFIVILVAPSLAVMLLAQLVFGATIGLMYYSSLFYAMDAHDSSSEHGGIHEAAIGIGNFVGPATGAAALWLAPQSATAGAWSVTALLALGLGALLWLRRQPVNK